MEKTIFSCSHSPNGEHNTNNSENSDPSACLNSSTFGLQFRNEPDRHGGAAFAAAGVRLVMRRQG
jgi:hypothetical protein